MGQIFSDEEDDGEPKQNLLFYQNKVKSRPWPGKRIEKMLAWKGNYYELENNHSYIQWLFPIPEGRGTNSSAQKLFDYEAKCIRENVETRSRFIRAYEMMLDFYGMHLVSEADGSLSRGYNWQSRLQHLNRSKHNFRRITRMIKSLGELGFEHYQANLVMFLMEETVVHRTVPSAEEHAMRFWIEAIHDDQERDEVRRRYFELTDTNPKHVSGYYPIDDKYEESKPNESPPDRDKEVSEDNEDQVEANNQVLLNGELEEPGTSVRLEAADKPLVDIERSSDFHSVKTAETSAECTTDTGSNEPPHERLENGAVDFGPAVFDPL